MFHLNYILNVMDITLNQNYAKTRDMLDEDFCNGIHHLHMMVWIAAGLFTPAFIGYYLNDSYHPWIIFTCLAVVSMLLVSALVIICRLLKKVWVMRRMSLKNTLAYIKNLEMMYDTNRGITKLSCQLKEIKSEIDHDGFNSLGRKIDMLKAFHEEEDREFCKVLHMMVRTNMCSDPGSLHKFTESLAMRINELDLPEGTFKYLKRRKVHFVRDIFNTNRIQLGHLRKVHTALLKLHPAYEAYILYPDKFAMMLLVACDVDGRYNDSLRNTFLNLEMGSVPDQLPDTADSLDSNIP